MLLLYDNASFLWLVVVADMHLLTHLLTNPLAHHGLLSNNAFFSLETTLYESEIHPKKAAKRTVATAGRGGAAGACTKAPTAGTEELESES